MLVLSRKVGESILIGEKIRVTVVSVHGSQIRLGFSAPNDVPIFREELFAFERPVVFNDSTDARP